MGYSIRTETYRYTLWMKWEGGVLKGDWEAAVTEDREELYNHTGDQGTNDYDKYENNNIASDPAVNGLKATLRALLKDQFAPQL